MPSLLARLGQLIPGFAPRPTPPALVVESPADRAARILAEARQQLDRGRSRPAPRVDERVPQNYYHGVAGKVWFLPYQDSATHDTPEIRAAMRLMARDPYVKAAWLPQIATVASEDWQVQPSEEGNADAQDQAAFVERVLKEHLGGGVPELVMSLCAPLGPDGFTLAEKVWGVAARGKLEGKIVLTAAKAKDPTYLHVKGDSFGNVTHVSSTRKNGDEFPVSDFLYVRYPGMFDEPLGMAAWRASYGAYWHRDTVRKLRVIHTEKKMAGMLVGTYAQGADDDKAVLSEALRAAKSSTWMAIPEGTRVEAVQLSTASEPDYKSFDESLREEIVTGIAWATLQSMTANLPGEGRGDAAVQKATADLGPWLLMTLVCQVVNEQLIPDLIDFNFPYPAAGGYPKLTFGAVSNAELLELVQVVEAAQRIGLTPSKKYYAKALSIQQADPNDPDDQMQAAGAGPMLPGGGGFGADPFAGFGEKRTGPVARFAEWTPYQGPEGGQGWRNGATGEVRYQREKPGSEAAGGPTLDRPDIGDDEPVELYSTDTGEVVWSGTNAESRRLVREAIEADGPAGVAGLAVKRPTESHRPARAPSPPPAPPPAAPDPLPPPSDYKSFRTGEPIEAVVYRGESKSGGGMGMAALGHGRYYGLEPAVANIFSKPGTVAASRVRLESPVVVHNKAEMTALKRRAEAATGLDFGGKDNAYDGYLWGDQPAPFTRALQAMGYDGIVTTYKEAPGGEQVVVFPPSQAGRAAFAEWAPYRGPEGGQGWRNPATGEVRYQAAQPDDDTDAPIGPALANAGRVATAATAGAAVGSFLGGPPGAIVGMTVGAAAGSDLVRGMVEEARAWWGGRDVDAVARGATAGDPGATSAVRENTERQVRTAAAELAKLPPADPAAVTASWREASGRMRASDAAELGDHVVALATERSPDKVEAAVRSMASFLGTLGSGALRLAYRAVKAFAGLVGRAVSGPFGIWAGSLVAGAAVLASPALALGAGLIGPATAFALAPVAVAGTAGVFRGARKVQAARGTTFAEWAPYTGPEGGTGWKNAQTGEVRYQATKPGDDVPGDDSLAGGTVEPLSRPGAVHGAGGLSKISVGGKAYLYKAADAAESAREEATAALAAIAGVAVPPARRATVGGRPGVVTGWVDGVAGDRPALVAAAKADPAAATGHAVFNFLAGAEDRHTGNYMVGRDGAIYSIDHSDSVPAHRSPADAAELMGQDDILDAMQKAQGGGDIRFDRAAVKRVAGAAPAMAAELRRRGMTDAAAGLEARGRVLAALAADPNPTESRLTELATGPQRFADQPGPPGPPPRSGLTWKEETDRWVTDKTAPAPRVGTPELAAVLDIYDAAPAGSPVRAYLDAAIGNSGPTGMEDGANPPKAVDPARLRRHLANAWKEAGEYGMAPADAGHLNAALAAAGAVRLHATGETYPFDPETMHSPVGLSTGTPVRVKWPGWGNLFKPNTPGALSYTKSVVEPAAETFADRPPATGLAGPDGERAEQLLATSRASGVAALTETADRAVRRLLMLPRPDRAASLFDDDELHRIAGSLAGSIAAADLLGRSRVRRRAELAGQLATFAEAVPDDPFHDFAEPVPALPPEEAVSYFRRLVPALADDPGRYGPALARHAFTLAVATEQTLLEKVKAAVLSGLATGADATADVQAVLDAAGVSPRDPSYAEMVVRTNTMDALNAGAMAEMQTPEMAEAFPVWRYDGVVDDRTGDDHRPLIGRHFPVSRSFAEVRGPRAFNCRCSPTPVWRDEAAELIRAGKVER